MKEIVLKEEVNCREHFLADSIYEDIKYYIMICKST